MAFAPGSSKRKHEDFNKDKNAKQVLVIDLISDDDDVIEVNPAPKRYRSSTPSTSIDSADLLRAFTDRSRVIGPRRLEAEVKIKHKTRYATPFRASAIGSKPKGLPFHHRPSWSKSPENLRQDRKKTERHAVSDGGTAQAKSPQPSVTNGTFKLPVKDETRQLQKQPKTVVDLSDTTIVASNKPTTTGPTQNGRDRVPSFSAPQTEPLRFDPTAVTSPPTAPTSSEEHGSNLADTHARQKTALGPGRVDAQSISQPPKKRDVLRKSSDVGDAALISSRNREVARKSSRQPVAEAQPRPKSQASTPQVVAHSPSTTPVTPAATKPTFSVVIDNRQRSLGDSPASLLKAFQGRPPDAKTLRNEKKKLFEELRKSADVARTRAASVERIFGLTSFNQKLTERDKEERLKLKLKLPPKLKKVNREEVQLDWGTPPPSGALRREDLLHPKEYSRRITERTITSAAGPPVTFVNDVNDKQLNGKFQFVTSYVVREGVNIRPSRRINRGCNDSCSATGCSPVTCICMSYAPHPAQPSAGETLQSSSHRGQATTTLTYTTHASGISVLSNSFLNTTGQEVYECTSSCPCTSPQSLCLNRVVQRGRTLPLEIFMTARCGFGLRCPTRPIYKGQFIDLYLGELLPERTLAKREDAKVEGASSYAFSLDWFRDDASIRHVDGEKFGSVCRYMNHSCEANCRVVTVMLEGKEGISMNEEGCYGLGFFAVRDIEPGEELTLDYNPGLSVGGKKEKGGGGEKVEGGEGEKEVHGQRWEESTLKCKCGAEKCRGVLWGGPKKRKGRGFERR